jgi:hypothetical protein
VVGLGITWILDGLEVTLVGAPSSAPALMIAAGLVAVFLAVAAERKTLEDVARPLTAVRRRVAAAMPAAAR